MHNPAAAWARMALLGLLPALAFALHRSNAFEAITSFYTGPGSYSRILATVLLALNWKSLPFAWNVWI